MQIDTVNVDETDKCEASDQKIILLKSRAIASLMLRTKLSRTFFRGSLAVVGAVKVIDKHNRS